MWSCNHNDIISKKRKSVIVEQFLLKINVKAELVVNTKMMISSSNKTENNVETVVVWLEENDGTRNIF